MAILNNFNICVVLLYSLVLIGAIICQIPEGNEGGECDHIRSGSPGTCKIIDNCTEAENELMQDINPQLCGFKGKVRVVCCRNTKFSPLKSAKPKVKINIKEGISRGLCLHYASKVYSMQSNIYVYGTGPTNTSLCGTTYRPLIHGGTLAAGKEFPHMALIGYLQEDEKVWQCGGSLISEEWVLTAAHCKYYFYEEARFVRLGDLDFEDNNDDAEPQDFEIVQIKTPYENSSYGYHDIALFKLNRKAKITAYIRPACLWTEREIKAKKSKANIDKLIVTGWGAKKAFGDRSSHLLQASLRLIPNCSSVFLSRPVIDHMHICAGTPANESLKDTCEGDSGGPLQIYADDVTCMYYIVGVTSMGNPCGLTRSAGVYTRVSNYISWIEETILESIRTLL